MIKYEAKKLLDFGIFAVYKPVGPTSSAVLNRLKDVLHKDLLPNFIREAIRMGHGGTLDGAASGVLVVATNAGCKKLHNMLHGGKAYRTTGKVGVETTTYNALGEVTKEMPFDHIKEQDLRAKLRDFVGTIQQLPPVYSALKLGGKRYSDLAREGVEVKLKPRTVTCYRAECTMFDPPHFEVSLSCGGGFYVRSLVHDLGKALGSCAHVVDLERTQHGPFTIEDCLWEENWSTERILEWISRCAPKFNEYERELSRKSHPQ